MNVFRVLIIILAFSVIAAGVVHIHLKKWHTAYLINQMYDKNQRLQREFTQIRLDLARYQSPETLLDRLRELNLPLEGLGLEGDEKKTTTRPATTTTKSASSKASVPAKPAKTKAIPASSKTRKGKER
jgi:hypothetical protein